MKLDKPKIIVFILFFLFGGCASKPECKVQSQAPASPETMGFIVGGKFLMGEAKSVFKDKPLTAKYVSNFYMDKTEVTNKMYKEYLGAKECNRTPKYIEDAILGADNLPVVDVTYADAKGFCTFYGKRLPTEAEWEYAGRGKLQLKKFPWGNNESVTMMNSRASKTLWAVAVKSYPANKYGLYDMAGNVREWVEDTYNKDFYSCHQKKLASKKDMDMIFTAKKDCRQDPLNKGFGRYKVTRGGSWHETDGYPCTISFRSFDKASYHAKDLGFRCASTAKEKNFVTEKLDELKGMFMEKAGENIPPNLASEELSSAFSDGFDPSSFDPANVDVSSVAKSAGVSVPKLDPNTALLGKENP